MSALKLAVFGASGRMGRLVCALTCGADDFELVAAVAHQGSSALGRLSVDGDNAAPTVTASLEDQCDVVIDFSTDAGASQALGSALEVGAAAVICTTGLSASTSAAIREAGKRIPVLVAPNTSLGIAVATDLVRSAVAALGPQYRVEIVEAHHRHKRDAPSGTAKLLGDAARAAGAEVGPEQVHSLRGGDVAGEHTVRLAGPGEYLEIRHVASGRELFARGALRAALRLVGHAPGVYSMQSLLGDG